MAMERFWEGSKPTLCELNGEKLEDKGEFVDGRLRFGGWGMWCRECYQQFGSGLGTGQGQHYKLQPTGRWLKIGG